MLSSIADPTLSFEKDELLKIKQIIKFIEMKEWTLEQAVALIKLLNDYVELDWTKFDMSDFANQFNCSPRSIKNALKEICSLEYREIDSNVVNKVSVG